MKGLSLRSAANVCRSKFRCARTSSGGVNAIHWFSDTQAKCAPEVARIGRAPLPLIVVCSFTIAKRHAAEALAADWTLTRESCISLRYRKVLAAIATTPAVMINGSIGA